MIIGVEDEKSVFEQLIQLLIDKKESKIVLTKNNNPIVQMTLINEDDNRRVGVTKEELKDFDKDNYDSIEINNLF